MTKLPERHTVTVLDTVRSAGAEVVTAGKRLLPLGLLLFLLYLSNLGEKYFSQCSVKYLHSPDNSTHFES